MSDDCLRSAFATRGFVAIRGLLTAAEVETLRTECDRRRHSVDNESLCANDCVLDATPSAVPERHEARTEAKPYLAARADSLSRESPLSTLPRSLSETAAAAGSCSHADAMSHLLLTKLPSLAALLLPPLDRPRDVRLFNEHFVVKPARIAGKFAWHTDGSHQLEALLSLGGPLATDSPANEYVSLWCALDDMTELNGALVLLPRDATQPPDAPWHEVASTASEAWLSVNGEGEALSTRGLHAGDAIAFSSQLWHRSEPNTSSAARRVYYAQYSSGPIRGLGGSTSRVNPPAAPSPCDGSGATVLAFAVRTACAAAAAAGLQGLRSMALPRQADVDGVPDDPAADDGRRRVRQRLTA